MKTFRELIQCMCLKSYGSFREAVTAQRIARMYGHCSRVENCLLCNGWHMHDR